MTEMMDMSSDLVGSGIPFLDYRMYAERIFFPGHRESPLRRDLDVQECRRQTVEQGLVQLSNLLNSKLFLTKVLSTTITCKTQCCATVYKQRTCVVINTVYDSIHTKTPNYTSTILIFILDRLKASVQFRLQNWYFPTAIFKKWCYSKKKKKRRCRATWH